MMSGESEKEEPSLRLQKYLSAVGAASRRKAEEMIRQKRVKVNGKVVTELGTKINPETDKIEVDGRLAEDTVGALYLMLNKPRGCVCTLKDDRGRPTVVDLLKFKVRVYPVGRLDFNSEGLLLLTNDGDFANSITHPTAKIPKVYEVKIKGVPNEKVLKRMTKGVVLDKVHYAFSSAKVLRVTGQNSWVEVTLYEGKNRQIRKVCKALGVLVIKLRRTKIGGVSLGKLAPGEYRELTWPELKKLRKATELV